MDLRVIYSTIDTTQYDVITAVRNESGQIGKYSFYHTCYIIPKTVPIKLPHTNMLSGKVRGLGVQFYTFCRARTRVCENSMIHISCTRTGVGKGVSKNKKLHTCYTLYGRGTDLEKKPCLWWFNWKQLYYYSFTSCSRRSTCRLFGRVTHEIRHLFYR